MGVAMSNEDGQTARRTDRQCRPALIRAAVLAFLVSVYPSTRLPAQVGHDPDQSPFQDVTTRQTITTFVSEFFGNRAHAGVGSQAGPAIGARFTTALSGPLERSEER